MKLLPLNTAPPPGRAWNRVTLVASLASKLCLSVFVSLRFSGCYFPRYKRQLIFESEILGMRKVYSFKEDAKIAFPRLLLVGKVNVMRSHELAQLLLARRPSIMWADGSLNKAFISQLRLFLLVMKWGLRFRWKQTFHSPCTYTGDHSKHLKQNTVIGYLLWKTHNDI